MIEIRKANSDEVKAIVKLIDSTFTKEGYGFVTSAQINTEVKNQRVWIALDGINIIGVRIGIDRVYNLAVHPDYRRQGIGKTITFIGDLDPELKGITIIVANIRPAYEIGQAGLRFFDKRTGKRYLVAFDQNFLVVG